MTRGGTIHLRGVKRSTLHHMPCPLEDILFKDCVAINPGIMRPKWYGNCVATYGHLTFFRSEVSMKVQQQYFHLNRWNHHELPNGHSHNLGFGKVMICKHLIVLKHDYSMTTTYAICIERLLNHVRSMVYCIQKACKCQHSLTHSYPSNPYRNVSTW